MEVTVELKCYSYRKNCDDCFKEKKFITKYVRFFFYCMVCVSVVSLSHTSEEGKTLLEYDSKEESLKFHFFYKFSDYVMFLFIHKRCYSNPSETWDTSLQGIQNVNITSNISDHVLKENFKHWHMDKLGFSKSNIIFFWHYFHILWSKGNKLQCMGKIQFLKILIFDNLIICILVKNSDS